LVDTTVCVFLASQLAVFNGRKAIPDRQFTDEFRRQAVKLVIERGVAQVFSQRLVVDDRVRTKRRCENG
jgi:hypothetical protein